MDKIDQFEERLKKKFHETFQYLLKFVRHPMNEIKVLPDWSWNHLIFVHLILSISSGVLAGLAAFNILLALLGIFILPIVSSIMSLLLAIFFYYYFQIFEKREVSFRRLLTLVIFTNLPFFVFQIGSYYLPPLTLLGFAFTGFLLVIGLSENFQLEKKRSLRLVLILFAVVFVVWVFGLIERHREGFN